MPDAESWPAFAFTQDSVWGRCYQAFLREKYERSGSQSTLDHYRQALILFFSDPAKLPDCYTREDVETFLHLPGRALGRIGNPPGVGTINNRLSVLSSFYSYAAGYTIAGEDGTPEPIMQRMSPATGLRHLQRTRPPYKGLTADELRRFFAAIPTETEQGIRDRALFIVYFFTARRRHEIVALRWGDITEEVIADHEERRTAYVYRFSGKGHSRESDSAELPKPAYDAIVRYLQVSGKADSIQKTDPVFTTCTDYHGKRGYDPHRPLQDVTVWHLVKHYASLAGLDPAKVTVHSFRHTSARMRYEDNPDIRAIQQLLRHASLATTHEYIYMLMTVADTGAKLLESRFGKL